MLLLARPYPDEPISGALVRGCRHFGLSLTTLARRSMNRHGLPLKFFGIAPLPVFAELFDMSAESLLAMHTVLPYATAFSEPDVYVRAVANTLDESLAPKSLGAFVQAALHGIPHRRFCRECVAEDIQKLGESYWRLSHQLPGCFVCHEHGTVLRRCHLKISGTSTALELPQDLKGTPCVPSEPSQIWLCISRSVASVAQRGLKLPHTRGGTFYRQQALKGGWLQPGREVNNAAVIALLAERFGTKMLEKAGVQFSSTSANWASLMLHPAPGIPFVTLKHLLMEHLLSGDVSDFSHKPSGPSAKSRANDDRTFAAAVRKVAMAHTTKGTRIRISDLLKEAGCWGPYRHGGVSAFPKLHAVVKSFQTSRSAYRPHALQMLAVPGSTTGEVATRQDLIRAGHLLCSKDAAAMLGIHWYQMKALQREGRIVCIQYAGRDWYPAFYADSGGNRQALEDVNFGTQDSSTCERWRALVRAHLLLSV